MTRPKIRWKVGGWIPKLEKKIDTYTWAVSETTARRNVVFKFNLPRWAIDHLEAWESPPKEEPKPNQQQLF